MPTTSVNVPPRSTANAHPAASRCVMCGNRDRLRFGVNDRWTTDPGNLIRVCKYSVRSAAARARQRQDVQASAWWIASCHASCCNLTRRRDRGLPAVLELRRSARAPADLTECLQTRMSFPGSVVHRSLTPRRSRSQLPHIAQREAIGWAFAVDRGGTFTDVVGTAPDGSLHTCKVLSRDPHRPADPALRGIGLLLERHGAACGRRVTSVRLGTTVATNALLERAGAPTPVSYTHLTLPTSDLV